ncbi:MAG: hypothetical protein ACR2OC_02380 [Solirubrobacterales bacterium]
MKLTVPHYYDFGEDRPLVGDDLLNPDAWDNLRTESNTIFVFHPDREEWDREIAGNAYQERRARQLIEWVEPGGVTRIASYGVGPAPVERWVHNLKPNWQLQLTDYGPRTVERLKTHFPEAETRRHNFVLDLPLKAELHLFCCVDTELTDEEWKLVLRNFSACRMLIYPCATFGLLTIVGELRQRGPGKKPTRCGFWRTKSRFDELISATHDLRRLESRRAGTAWLCEPKEPAR